MSVEYISRKVMDRYFDKFTRKLVRMNIRIMETEAAWLRHAAEVDDLRKQVTNLQEELGVPSDDSQRH